MDYKKLTIFEILLEKKLHYQKGKIGGRQFDNLKINLSYYVVNSAHQYTNTSSFIYNLMCAT